MVSSRTPTLERLRDSRSEGYVRALLYVAICEVCDFFNVGKNMTGPQVLQTTELILDSFPQMKLEEIKYCFRRQMRSAKVYDRLDGNIIIGWLSDYESERTEEIMNLNHNADAEQRAQAAARAPGDMDFESFMRLTRAEAEQGDPEAKKALANISSLRSGGFSGNFLRQLDGIRKHSGKKRP